MFQKILFVLVLLGFYLAYLNGTFDQYIAQFNIASKNFSDVTCDDVTKSAEGDSIKNFFGLDLKMVKVGEGTKISKNDSSIICRANVVLENGDEYLMSLKVSKDTDDNIWIEYSTID